MGSEKGKKRPIIGGGFKVHINEAEAAAAMGQFRELKLRRQIMDAAKKHTEEIDLLRKELDRRRRATLPEQSTPHLYTPVWLSYIFVIFIFSSWGVNLRGPEGDLSLLHIVGSTRSLSVQK